MGLQIGFAAFFSLLKRIIQTSKKDYDALMGCLTIILKYYTYIKYNYNLYNILFHYNIN